MSGENELQESLPLERRKIHSSQNGVGQIFPALHKNWVEPREWISYQAPPVGRDLSVVGAKDAWFERSIFVLDDLEFIISLPYHKFWSQLVYDNSLRLNLGKLLRLLPRPHHRFSPHSDGDVRGMLTDILHKTFLIFLRLSTHKESHTDFMGVASFGKLIYDNFIFDIPKIIDIVVLFHSGNPALVEKMICNIFASQPAYEGDLAKCVDVMGQTMSKTLERIESMILYLNCDSEQAVAGLIDLVTYTTDIAVSLHSLLKAYPKSAVLIHRGLDQQLAGLYQNGLVPVQLYIRNQKETGFISDEIFDFLTSRILLARHSCLHTFRAVISNCFVTPALEEGHKANLGEEFLEALSSVIPEPKFYQDYSRLFPIQDDLDIFNQAGLEIDPLRLSYLSQGGEAAPLVNQVKQKPKNINNVKAEPVVARISPEPELTKNPNKSKISGVEMDSLISQVRDVFPDLGEGFVELCLEYCDLDPEKVINALLEDNLPPHLTEVDRRKVRVPKQVEQPSTQAVVDPLEVLSNRNNVFDGDEFDVNTTTDIDRSRIHKGKKKMAAKNANALLNDKKELAGMKDRFSALSMVSDVVYDVDYDDEYDDTYDDNAMGEREPDADEMLERRPFVVPRALGGGGSHAGQSESEEEEEEIEANDNGKKRFDFARNPEEMRAEAERKWNSKMAARGGGGAHRSAPPSRDVVGRAKGQGQDQSVLRNRARKNENKGKNIRNAADRKMAKGMF